MCCRCWRRWSWSNDSVIVISKFTLQASSVWVSSKLFWYIWTHFTFLTQWQWFLRPTLLPGSSCRFLNAATASFISESTPQAETICCAGEKHQGVPFLTYPPLFLHLVGSWTYRIACCSAGVQPQDDDSHVRAFRKSCHATHCLDQHSNAHLQFSSSWIQ